MKKPIIIINFKAYDTSFGKKGIEIAKKIQNVSKQYSTEIIVSVPATMIYQLSSELEIPVFAEHVDGVPLGAYTGSIMPEMIKDVGAKGSLLNHSEKRIRLDEIDDALKRLRGLGLESVVCVDRYDLVVPMSLLKPTAVLIEPPELIGSGISVSKAKPEVITRAVNEISKVKDVYLVAGAGITTGEDAYRAIELGADGIGLASAVMKARDPEKIVEELVINSLKACDENE
ncbi:MULTISPECIES: triose-phosphate isomerase [Acidianus]|uniref:Triosephosphate isomerase n=1 Tax=Candidatus Acidianus copahuensis TaxID=1160895 RepID=A0A031LNM1_9CREN|nr:MULTISPECIES: triose-phosphate isomerase [Acidianus]EZQ04739.1 triosephosphate isomerase [Candidatus Acidianus copahuensis]NON63141.1 triose-phosphate isomerase [Acidianus sp. RZ1]